MRRILIAECKQEVSTFNPIESGYDDFAISRAEEILTYHRGRRSEVGGALGVFDERNDLELVPAYAARQITSGGPLAHAAFQQIARELLQAVEQTGPIDGVYFSMHGAMATTEEMDPEGCLLKGLRRIVGEEVPVVVSLDLHGILTDRMVAEADAVVMFHTYPHVDFWGTGHRAAKLLLRILDEGVRPVTAKVEIPALVRGDELITESGFFGECIRAAQAVEFAPGGLVAGMFIGNPFTDVPDLRSYSVVVTDNDAETAEREATRLAWMFWQQRERMQARLIDVATSVQLAQQSKGTVALVDAADATSSGASGDSNAILRELIRANYRGTALIPLVDPLAVRAAWKAGVGNAVTTSFGGALDRGRFQPLSLEGRVRMLSDGRFHSESFGEEWLAGDTAVIAIEAITLVVTSRAVSLYDRALFFAHGLDPKRFDLVVVKSPHCERHMYADWCTRLINVDAPGSSSANLRSLGHTRCRRPVFPLDPGVEFQPVAKLFRRAAEKVLS